VMTSDVVWTASMWFLSASRDYRCCAKNFVTQSSASHGDIVSDFIRSPLSMRGCWLGSGRQGVRIKSDCTGPTGG